MTEFDPRIPHSLGRKVEPGLFDPTPYSLKRLERVSAKLDDATLELQMTAQIAEPAQPSPFEVALQSVYEDRWMLLEGKRSAGIGTGHDREQHCHICSTSPHGACSA